MSSIEITTKTEIEDCVCELSVEIEFTDIFRQLAKTTVHSYEELRKKGKYVIMGYKLGLEKCKEIVAANPDIEKIDFKEGYKEEILKEMDTEIYIETYPVSVSILVDAEGFYKILDLATDGYKLGLKHYLGIYKENKKTWNIFVKGGR